MAGIYPARINLGGALAFLNSLPIVAKKLLSFLHMEREFHAAMMIVSQQFLSCFNSFLYAYDEFAFSLQNRCD